ncbi:MaoC family dehydratase [bacterium LRH843]|nr:MaoC family dehydratase [bacterium LRH843]
MWEKLVGTCSVPVKNKIDKEEIKKFALAIGEPLPIYIDEQFAKQSKHGRILAPPTFPRTLDFGEIKGMKLPSAGLIHGEQMYQYTRPLYEGEIIHGQCQLLACEKKQSRNGTMLLIKLKQTGFDEDENEIFTSIRTLIMTEKLLKEVCFDDSAK